MTTALPSHVTVSQEVLFQSLDDQAIWLDLQKECYYGSDEIGLRLWQLFTELGDVDAVMAQMLKEYDVDEESLRKDIVHFINELAEAGLLKIS
jgi:hypothetical protein